VEGQTDVSCGPDSDGQQQLVLLPLHLRRGGDQVQEALCVVGKLAVQPCLNTVTPGLLFHIEDQHTHIGVSSATQRASYTILPHQSSTVASGPLLHCPAAGPSNVGVTFNNKQYKWIFLLADVSFAIIGIDFLKHFKLVVDAAAGQLIDTRTVAVIPAVSSGDKGSATTRRGGVCLY
jgi:hypothetical protein